MALSISVLSGITFEYDIPNTENEVLLLVDLSDSSSESSTQKKNTFIQSVVDSADSMFKLGIVTFGFDQVYAAELTNNTENLYMEYLRAPLPDTTATDISSALTYASGLFKNPESARIVLLSDGVETDNRAKEVIKSIAAQQIKVDTVGFSEESGDEVQIMRIETPERNVRVGENFKLIVHLESNYVGEATLTLSDNATEMSETSVELINGQQSIEIDASFGVPGLHSLSLEMSANGDKLTQNNVYNSYMYLEVFDDILIIESIVDESESVKNMLNDEYNVTVIRCDDAEKMPKTLNELRAYDEVIMVNVSNDDLPEGFDQILYSYVYDVGGGLFTVCGSEENSTVSDPIANAFTREDMYGTLYQQMLPVEVINYTPPVAVMIIIDRSGSMWNDGVPEEQTPLYAAKQGAAACLDALTERDWVGIMTLEDTYTIDIKLTPRTQRDKILSAIEEIEVGGGTIYTAALERAARALAACDVEKRHIIMVSDGQPGDDPADYLQIARQIEDMGITMSYIGINCTNEDVMIELLEAAGSPAENYHGFTNDDIDRVPSEMREELEQPEIKDVNYETFQPTIHSFGSIVTNINQKDIPTLDGFYGSRAKEGAEVVLMGEYVPIYAQWKFGKGMVGSFMCDLNGTWSYEFVNSSTGAMLVENIVTSLFPVADIRPNDVSISLKEENYYNRLSIFTDVTENETIQVTVTGTAADGTPITQTLTPSATDGFSRLSIVVKDPGVHEILVQKKDAEGKVLAETKTYKAFSYSQEYNIFVEPTTLMEDLAESGEGEVITDPYQVFENVVKFLHRVIDPRIPFIIIAICAFLLDIAARKFKFKWPHEIIRDHKAKKAMGQGQKGNG
ncbi:MAG: VWA domain-containing protein [Clostridia bacterium]|nr:VWA domain-containing protein [Clostridia bacterium]